MGRLLKDIPKIFNRAKAEYDRLVNLFWCTRLDENKKRIENAENLGLHYVLNQEFLSFAQLNFEKTGEKILEYMEKNNTKEIFLYDYGKVIKFDDEAQWLFVEDISQAEWKNYDLTSSENYVESKKGKEKKNGK